MVDLDKIAKALNEPHRGWVDFVETEEMATMVAELTASRVMVAAVRRMKASGVGMVAVVHALAVYDCEVQP